MYNYQCFNTTDREACNACSKRGQVLTDEKDEHTCPCDGKALKLMGEITAGGLIGMHRDRNIAERRKRNKKHFINETLPKMAEIDPDFKRHHFKKLGIKN